MIAAHRHRQMLDVKRADDAPLKSWHYTTHFYSGRSLICPLVVFSLKHRSHASSITKTKTIWWSLSSQVQQILRPENTRWAKQDLSFGKVDFINWCEHWYRVRGKVLHSLHKRKPSHFIIRWLICPMMRSTRELMCILASNGAFIRRKQARCRFSTPTSAG